MQLLNEVRNTASRRRGRLPALLAMGALFLFVLSACQVAVAEDGSINIKPDPANADTTGNNSQAGVSNTLAGFVAQTGEVAPTTVSPIDPDQVYEWNGLIKWVDLEGGHFVIDRGCDNWAVIPADDEVYAKLKELHGEKGTVWGTVNFDKNIYGRRAIDATAAFAPGDIRPLIALPQIPCDDRPVPGPHIAVNHSEITLHGDLVWRGGRLWLVTPRGNVRLELPQLALDMFPELSDAATAGDSTLSISLGEYGVVGMWDLASTGLVIKVREIKEWPHRTFVRDHCGGGFHHFVVGDEQLAAHGTLVVTDGQWLLRTKSGVIFVHRNTTGGVLIDPATGDVTDVRPDILRTHDVVVIGDWKTDGTELHMEGDRFVRVKTKCEPPQPPRPPILPGEIAALGTLVFENGRPFLNTPSGRIVLLTRNDVPGSEPQPVDPSFFEDVAPEVMDAAGTAEIDPNRPDVVRPVRHILVVGKWLLYRDHLAIVVRYALPWPYPYPQPIDPVPMPEPQPVPPIFDYSQPLPQPVPPVLGGPVKPLPPVVDVPDVIQPDFDGFEKIDDIADDGVIIIRPVDGDKKDVVIEVKPADSDRPTTTITASGIPVNSFNTDAVN